MAELSRLEATFNVSTPLFMGGADPAHCGGVRPPGVKGALRFWWRALQWPTALQEAGGEEAKALAWLHEREALLFGSASKEGTQSGQGAVLLSIPSQSNGKQIPKGTERFPGNTPITGGIDYLLGMGLWHFRNKLQREALAEASFALRLTFRPGTDSALMDSVESAVLALGTMGGLGSRARAGMGSLALSKLVRNGEKRPVPSSPTELADTIACLLAPGKAVEHLPPFTAVSALTRVSLGAHESDACSVLRSLGREMQFYRSYGRNGKVLHEPAERNFADDHDLCVAAAQNKPPTAAPRRAIFGLPHNYHFSSNVPDIEVNASGSKRARRASPLLMHVHAFPNGNAVAVQCLFPATFLSADDRVTIAVKGRGRQSYSVPGDLDNWQDLHAYLDRFEDRKEVVS